MNSTFYYLFKPFTQNLIKIFSKIFISIFRRLHRTLLFSLITLPYNEWPVLSEALHNFRQAAQIALLCDAQNPNFLNRAIPWARLKYVIL